MKKYSAFGNKYDITGEGSAESPFQSGWGGDFNAFVLALAHQIEPETELYFDWNGAVMKMTSSKTELISVTLHENHIESLPTPEQCQHAAEQYAADANNLVSGLMV